MFGCFTTTVGLFFAVFIVWGQFTFATSGDITIATTFLSSSQKKSCIEPFHCRGRFKTTDGKLQRRISDVPLIIVIIIPPPFEAQVPARFSTLANMPPTSRARCFSTNQIMDCTGSQLRLPNNSSDSASQKSFSSLCHWGVRFARGLAILLGGLLPPPHTHTPHVLDDRGLHD